MKKFFKLSELMIAMVIVAILFIGAIPQMSETRSQITYILKQLNTKTDGQLNGTFFLGSGNINGKTELYYYFYVQDESGRTTAHREHINNVIIYEDIILPKTPYAEYNKCISITDLDRRRWNLHIPKNSILQEYNPNFK
jgi:hypothetical protein